VSRPWTWRARVNARPGSWARGRRERGVPRCTARSRPRSSTTDARSVSSRDSTCRRCTTRATSARAWACVCWTRGSTSIASTKRSGRSSSAAGARGTSSGA
jgi:hypothetical protein